jgi:TolB-like protein/lipoprotein NlpI
MKQWLHELRRRKVFSVGAAYVVVAWLLLQVAATVFPIFDAPGWVLKVFTVALVLGFPVAVILAWAYELTPRGVVRTTEEKDAAASAGTEPGAQQGAAGVQLPTGPSIAVLPFRDLSGDEARDLFAESLTNDIISGLTRSSHLFVLGGSATAALQQTGSDLAGAGQSLGVSYLLSGTVQKAGAKLRVSAELTDVSKAQRVWSQKYDRELSAANLFDMQDDIREQIVATLSDLHGVIYSTQSRRSLRRPTESLNAYECLTVALAYDRQLTPEYHRLARDSLERAVAIDPNFDSAWAHLSWIYTDEEVFGFNPLPDPMGRALTAARKGVELNPENYHNHWLLSRVHYFMGRRDLFLSEAQKSLDLNSSDGTTLGLVGMYTAWAGDWERGIDMLEKARLLNPNHPDYYFSALGMADFVRGDYAAALAELLKANLPQWLPHQAFVAACLVKLQRPAEARQVIEQLEEALPGLDSERVAATLTRALPFQQQLVESVMGCLQQTGLSTAAV